MILSQEDIKRHVEVFFKDKPVNKVWLFGSYARGESDEQSDVDILISFQKDSKVGLRYLVWGEEMEEVVHKKVQIVSDGGVSKYVKPFIDADKVLLYEKCIGR